MSTKTIHVTRDSERQIRNKSKRPTEMSNNVLSWCRKYLSIPTVLFIFAMVFILFFQENSVGRIRHNQVVIDSLNQEITRYNDTLDKYRELNNRLDRGDAATIERVVREQHDMSLPDEDVYVFK